MKTRINDVPLRGFSFQYGEGKHPDSWHFVGGDQSPATWSTQEKRDRARACFTHRRSVQAAIADLKRAGLLT